MLLVSDLLKIKGQAHFKSNYPKQFKYVSIDSRKVSKNEIFFALKGEKHDAHAYLEQVFLNGCQLAIVNEGWYKQHHQKFTEKNFYVVPDTTLALGQFANQHKKRLKIKTLVVGGSNGKTTTKEMLAAVLSKKYNVLFTTGNFNNHIGVPLTLLRLNEKHTFCVLEIGCNHFNEIKYLCQVAEPDYGLITNIGKEHLEFFKTKAGVAKAEFEMLDYFEQAKQKTIFFANVDDDNIRKKADTLVRSKVIRYGYNFPANFVGIFTGYSKKLNPQILVKHNALKNQLFEINAFGKHSLFNGLAAVAVAHTLKVEKEVIAKALKNFKSGSNKRMEVLKQNGLTVINDTYNSNPDSVLLGLSTLSEINSTARKHVALGDMLELGASSKKEHSLIGKAVKNKKLTYLYTFGPDSLFTSQAAGSLSFNKHFLDKEKLITALKNNLTGNDLIYVKGSRGMKMEEVAEAVINFKK